jgi:hypothetical protein
VTPLVEALLAEGWAVQLAHEPKETTQEDHGFVIVRSASGALLAESRDFQHNPFARTFAERTKQMMESVRAELEKQEGSELTSDRVTADVQEKTGKDCPAPSDSEGSTMASEASLPAGLP